MRGRVDDQPMMFFSINVEERIRKDHPLRPIKKTVDRILKLLSDRFEAAYSRLGRPSVPPERLLKALLLQALYSVRSERQLVERADTDLLFRWFLDMDPAEEMFNATDFTKNRPRLDQHGLTGAFFQAVVQEAIDAGLTSDEHFSVDGTLIESCASVKSFRPVDQSADDSDQKPGGTGGFKSRNPEVDFHRKKRSNRTHRSTTDPEARLYRKGRGKESQLCHMGHSVSENRNGLIMAVCVSEASGAAEREAALDMIDSLKSHHGVRPGTLGADKGYDSGPWVVPGTQVPRSDASLFGDQPAASESEKRHFFTSRQRRRPRANEGPAQRHRLPVEPALSKESRRGLRLAENDCRPDSLSTLPTLETESADRDFSRRLRPCPTHQTDSDLNGHVRSSKRTSRHLTTGNQQTPPEKHGS